MSIYSRAADCIRVEAAKGRQQIRGSYRSYNPPRYCAAGLICEFNTLLFLEIKNPIETPERNERCSCDHVDLEDWIMHMNDCDRMSFDAIANALDAYGILTEAQAAVIPPARKVTHAEKVEA